MAEKLEGGAQVRVGTYVGPLWQLKGKTANCWCYPTGVCLATFDDPETGYGDSRHTFNTSNFELDKPLDWEGGEDLA